MRMKAEHERANQHKGPIPEELTRSLIAGIYGITTSGEHTVIDGGVILSDTAMELLKEAAADARGYVLTGHSFSGYSVDTNDKSLVEDGKDPRGVAKWRTAVEELMSLGLLERSDAGEHLLLVTSEGYAAADRL